MKLQDPQEYMPALEKLRERDKYAKSWKLRVEKRTNRHRETDGGCWGWYEVQPLGITVGCWGTDLCDIEIADVLPPVSPPPKAIRVYPDFKDTRRMTAEMNCPLCAAVIAPVAVLYGTKTMVRCPRCNNHVEADISKERPK